MSKNRSKIGTTSKQSRNRYRHNKRDSISIQKLDLEPALMIVDVPNVNAQWHMACKRANLKGLKVPYRMLGYAYAKFLHKNFRDKKFEVTCAAFVNTREDHNYEYFNILKSEYGWTIILKPKIESDDDIDPNIREYVDFILQEKPFMHVLLVGNDLQNYAPIAHRLMRENIKVTLCCVTKGFEPQTFAKIEQTELDVIDFKDFMQKYSSKMPTFPW